MNERNIAQGPPWKTKEELTQEIERKISNKMSAISPEDVVKFALEFAKYTRSIDDLEGNNIGNSEHYLNNFGYITFNSFIDKYYE